MATAQKLKFGSPEWRAKYLGKAKPKNPKAPAMPSKPVAKKSAGKGKNWIKGATGTKGALHKSLGIPMGTVIPLATLQTAAKRKDKVGQQARLALTLRNINKKK